MAKTFGENMRRIRIARGYTLEALAKALDLKRPAQLSALETGSTVPRVPTILRLAAALKCEPWELMDDVEMPHDVVRRKESQSVSSTAGATFRRRGTGKKVS